MFTRKLIIPGSGALLTLLGLFSHQTAAMEEIVVYGVNVAAHAEARQALFRSERAEYRQSVNEQLKLMLDDDLKRVTAPQVELAASETGIRG